MPIIDISRTRTPTRKVRRPWGPGRLNVACTMGWAKSCWQGPIISEVVTKSPNYLICCDASTCMLPKILEIRFIAC